VAPPSVGNSIGSAIERSAASCSRSLARRSTVNDHDARSKRTSASPSVSEAARHAAKPPAASITSWRSEQYGVAISVKPPAASIRPRCERPPCS
jgi:hypothetical protein